MSNTSTGPVVTLKDHYLKATIWKNESDKGPFYGVDLSRTYKEGDEYKTSRSFSGRDILAAGNLMQRAYEETVKMEQADYEASKPSQSR